MKYLKCIISVFLAVAICVLAVPSVNASYTSQANHGVASWADMFQSFSVASDGLGVPILPFVFSALGELLDPNSICMLSGDGRHHGNAVSLGGGRSPLADTQSVTCLCDYSQNAVLMGW